MLIEDVNEAVTRGHHVMGERMFAHQPDQPPPPIQDIKAILDLCRLPSERPRDHNRIELLSL